MPSEGWNAPGLHYVEDFNVKSSFQDLRDYLGPYSMQLVMAADSANQTAAAFNKVPFDTVLFNVGDKFKRSTDGFGIVLPWAGVYNCHGTVQLEVVPGTATNTLMAGQLITTKYDEATVIRDWDTPRLLWNPAADVFPTCQMGNTIAAGAGDRVYLRVYYANVTGAMTSFKVNGAGAGDPNIHTGLTVTYVGKT